MNRQLEQASRSPVASLICGRWLPRMLATARDALAPRSPRAGPLDCVFVRCESLPDGKLIWHGDHQRLKFLRRADIVAFQCLRLCPVLQCLQFCNRCLRRASSARVRSASTEPAKQKLRSSPTTGANQVLRAPRSPARGPDCARRQKRWMVSKSWLRARLTVRTRQ